MNGTMPFYLYKTSNLCGGIQRVFCKQPGQFECFDRYKLKAPGQNESGDAPDISLLKKKRIKSYTKSYPEKLVSRKQLLGSGKKKRSDL